MVPNGRWAIMDGVLVVYDPADTPEWMKQAVATRDEDGNSPGFYTSLERVSGVCPMGCGSTLFLGDGGHVTCSLLGCPNPGAVDELLSIPDTPDGSLPTMRAEHALMATVKSADEE